ncbi:MAG: large subunit ribosomal protein L24 [Phycisphaerales bacterium]|jgi:large subunit ribosomal protein L24
MPAHVRTGDNVMVTSGKLKGQTGEILSVNPSDQKVIVKGLNMVTRHMKPSQLNPEGGKVVKEAPIHKSNVSPVVGGKPTRVRFVTKPDGSKVRIAAIDGSELGEVRSAKAKG